MELWVTCIHFSIFIIQKKTAAIVHNSAEGKKNPEILIWWVLKVDFRYIDDCFRTAGVG